MTVSLFALGWGPHFEAQTGAQADAEPGSYGRVAEVHRDRVVIRTTTGEDTLAPGRAAGEIAVGDWVQLDAAGNGVARVLDRRTTLRRKAPAAAKGEQLMAANVDTLFIVTSCNADFNPARLERYLTLAAAGNIAPVIILTKADLGGEAEAMRAEAESLSPLATALAVNALDGASLAPLFEWLQEGQTGALVGSSGVGKSTILNALTGAQVATQGIREDDAKGRHTTTSRSLRPARSGGLLIDTPGIRELSLVNSAEAINEVFADVTDLVGQCRFSDCTHETEPGCAVRDAVEAGTLDPDRLRRWRKLLLEDRHNSETPAETRLRQKLEGRRGPKR